MVIILKQKTFHQQKLESLLFSEILHLYLDIRNFSLEQQLYFLSVLFAMDSKFHSFIASGTIDK